MRATRRKPRSFRCDRGAPAGGCLGEVNFMSTSTIGRYTLLFTTSPSRADGERISFKQRFR